MLPEPSWRDRARYLGSVRRTFTRTGQLQRVGYIGANEVHSVKCREYQEADRWPTPGNEAIYAGSLDSVFQMLVDDYPTGAVPFPALHDCLRDTA